MSDKTSGSMVKFPDLMSMNTKSVYWEIITKIQTPPTVQIKLNAAFDNTISYLDWQNIYLLPGYTTIDTSTRVFQYKILNRILYTNKILFKMKLVASPMCTFCHDHEESLEYLFFYCSYAQEFWRSVSVG